MIGSLLIYIGGLSSSEGYFFLAMKIKYYQPDKNYSQQMLRRAEIGSNWQQNVANNVNDMNISRVTTVITTESRRLRVLPFRIIKYRLSNSNDFILLSFLFYKMTPWRTTMRICSPQKTMIMMSTIIPIMLLPTKVLGGISIAFI